MADDTIWLPQRLIAELFQVSVKTVNEHLVNIYNEQELDPSATIRKFRIVQTEGSREVSRVIDHYNLDAILAVGYRVRSHRGTQFRIWATERLREYLVKGFAMDDERLKRAGGGDYFEELLARIRDMDFFLDFRNITDHHYALVSFTGETELRRLRDEFPSVEFTFDTGGMMTAALNLGEPSPVHFQITGLNLHTAQEIARRPSSQPISRRDS